MHFSIFNKCLLAFSSDDCLTFVEKFHILKKEIFYPCLQATPVTISVGSQVWIEDQEEAWIDGEVLSIDGDKVRVQTSNGKEVIFFNSLPFCSITH